ncbi:hypothetical protein GUJ93_ZPchr0001g30615 [Zizania palustris]|uniref:Uncharacterized protein n=1 Tax=Zizania palustris TaxID=103762 RepID=A0A8J5S958_ZIZPA|nr:hypothetical protein GUJ93_ZPchr0001g30615 [Zizania palustris]
MAEAVEAGAGDKYRSFMYDEGEKDTVWRLGAPPNYDVVNKLFEEERTKVSHISLSRRNLSFKNKHPMQEIGLSSAIT